MTEVEMKQRIGTLCAAGTACAVLVLGSAAVMAGILQGWW